MRAYLTSFFADFAYEEADAAVLLAAYDRITSDAAAAVSWQELLDAYETDINCDYAELLKRADGVAAAVSLHEYTVELLLFICFSRHTKAAYIARGLDLQIYHDSMLDLKYKLEECKLVQPLWKSGGQFLKNLKAELPYDPEIPLLGISRENSNLKRYMHPYVHVIIYNSQNMETTSISTDR